MNQTPDIGYSRENSLCEELAENAIIRPLVVWADESQDENLGNFVAGCGYFLSNRVSRRILDMR